MSSPHRHGASLEGCRSLARDHSLRTPGSHTNTGWVLSGIFFSNFLSIQNRAGLGISDTPFIRIGTAAAHLSDTHQVSDMGLVIQIRKEAPAIKQVIRLLPVSSAYKI